MRSIEIRISPTQLISSDTAYYRANASLRNIRRGPGELDRALGVNWGAIAVGYKSASYREPAFPVAVERSSFAYSAGVTAEISTIQAG